VLLPVPTLAALVVWTIVMAASRYISLASLAAALALCLFRLGLTVAPFGDDQRILTAFCFLAAVLVFARHVGNIARLWRGTENRLKDSSTMLLLAKSLHVLSLGLWFGASVFFTFVVGLSLFSSFEKIAILDRESRPNWFPLADDFAGNDQTRKEQGIRAAGYAISPMFDVYYPLQVGCGLCALVLAWSWAGPGWGNVHALRTLVLALALASVVVGWWLGRVVHDNRMIRYAAADLAQREPTVDNIKAADAARAEFGRLHFYSLMLNFLTLFLVLVGMILAAQLPTPVSEPVVQRAPMLTTTT
jgi:hypothetical protein